MDFESSGFESSGVALVPASLVTPLSCDDPIIASISTPAAIATSPLPQIPRNWRQVMDDRGRIYYYHAKQRIAQWEPPSPEEETPEFSSEEESEADDGVECEAANSKILTEITVCENSKEQARLKRRSLLCFERIISPRNEFERSDDAQRYRELKERLLRHKLSRIRERGLWLEDKKSSSSAKPADSKSKLKEKDKDKRKLNEKEKQRKRAKEKYKRSLMKGASRRKVKEKIEMADVKENEDDVVDNDHFDEAFERDKCDLMDGSIDDDLLMNLGEDDGVGDHERDRDVSANTVRKIKDAFRMKISSVIVQILNPYRKPDCRLGRIACTEDFKHLARKVFWILLDFV